MAPQGVPNWEGPSTQTAGFRRYGDLARFLLTTHDMSSLESSQFCGSCGQENPPEAVRCVHCSDVLDPTATTPAADAPALDPRTVAIVGALAAVLIVILQVAGAGFSMRLLPASATPSEVGERIQALVDDEVLESSDAAMLEFQLARERRLRTELNRGSLSPEATVEARERLPGEDQSTVLGVGGTFSFIPVVIMFLLAAAAGTLVARGSRTREVALGLATAAAVQAGLWLGNVEFDVGALVDGRLVMVGVGPAFVGGPVLLLTVAMVFCVTVGTGLSAIVGLALDQAQGKTDCPHCGHFFTARADQHQCPACTRPLRIQRATDTGTGGMTRSETGADALLCVQCAKTYAADSCPVHPREPLLDPRRDDVRLQLIDLDTQAGTQRFAAWTEGLGTRPEDRPSEGGVCMECAKAYDRVCALHPDEPLLDPSREDVRLQMQDTDDRHRNTVGVRLMFVGLGCAMTLTIGLTSLLDLDGALTLYTFVGTLTGAMAVARVLTPSLSPPRYGQWTGAEATSREALAADAQRELLGPAQRWLVSALSHLGALAAIAAGGAAVGAGLGLALGWPLALSTVGGVLLGALAFAVYVNVKETSKDLRKTASTVASEWRDPYGS